MCALGCWWGGKIAVLQFFFPVLVSKTSYKKQQIYIHDVKAPTDIFISLWFCSAANNIIFFFFYLSLLWKLTKFVRPLTSICDRRFSLLNFFFVWIKVLHHRQSLCEAQQIVKGGFLCAAPEPWGLGFIASFFDYGTLCFFKLLRYSELRQVKGQHACQVEGEGQT